MWYQIHVSSLPEPVAEYQFARPRRWRFDLAWPDRRLAVEVEGGTWANGRHTRPAGYEADCEKCNAAALAGWRVLRVTGAMVKDGRALAAVVEALGSV
jgi:very-short-patch-repair endonuclease